MEFDNSPVHSRKDWGLRTARGLTLPTRLVSNLEGTLLPPLGSCLESQVECPEMDNQLVLAPDTLAAMVPLLAKVLAAMGLLAAAAATQLEECYLLAANQLLRPIAAARALVAPEALVDQKSR